jgi:hypothetical protein
MFFIAFILLPFCGVFSGRLARRSMVCSAFDLGVLGMATDRLEEIYFGSQVRRLQSRCLDSIG